VVSSVLMITTIRTPRACCIWSPDRLVQDAVDSPRNLEQAGRKLVACGGFLSRRVTFDW